MAGGALLPLLLKTRCCMPGAHLHCCPACLQGGARWQDLFFDKLTDHVKLVGPTIRCAGADRRRLQR